MDCKHKRKEKQERVNKLIRKNRNHTKIITNEQEQSKHEQIKQKIKKIKNRDKTRKYINRERDKCQEEEEACRWQYSRMKNSKTEKKTQTHGKIKVSDRQNKDEGKKKTEKAMRLEEGAVGISYLAWYKTRH